MNETTPISPGRYRHFKGKEYSVVGIAHHSETLEELVVYRQEYGNHRLWVRPKEMFLEEVKVDGQEAPRFQCLDEDQTNRTNAINLFADIPGSLPKEFFQTLLSTTNLRIE